MVKKSQRRAQVWRLAFGVIHATSKLGGGFNDFLFSSLPGEDDSHFD